MNLTFDQLRTANAARGTQWDGKPAHIDDLSFRAMELGGETGEALNVAKKLVRELTGRVGGMKMDDARAALSEELADVVICADRVAEVMGIDLAPAIVAKFNKTSRKHGLVEIVESDSRADDSELATLREENAFLHDLMDAFEWQRIKRSRTMR